MVYCVLNFMSSKMMLFTRYTLLKSMMMEVGDLGMPLVSKLCGRSVTPLAVLLVSFQLGWGDRL